MSERKLIPEELYSEYKQVEKWAVIVGISKYEHQPWNLNYAHRDAEELHKLLLTENGGNFKRENIRLLTNREATKRNIEIALHDFLQKPDKNDLVMLYFACHGAPNPRRLNGNLYLLAYDTEPEKIAATGLRMREIDDVLRDTLIADKVIILADTCHSGGIGGNLGNRSISDHSQRVNEYLNRLGSAKPGVALLTSAEAREVSREGKEWGGGHGVFTHFVLEGMQGKADTNNNGIVTVGELFEYVQENVKQATNNRQHPSIGTNKYDRNLPLAIKADLEAKTSPAEKYRQEVRKILADRPLNPITEFNLKNLPRRLGIPEIEAKNILQAEWQRIEEAKENYQTILQSTIKEGYDPLDSKIQQQLKDLQATLQLNDLEVKEITDSIFQDQAKIYFQQADNNYDLKEYEKAIADYTEAIRLNPNYAEAHNNRGLTYHYLKEYEKAIADYNEAIRLNPNYAEAHNSRGLSYYELKEYEKAIADYIESIRLNNPEPWVPYNNRGLSYYELKEYEKAIADYNEAIRLNPNYAKAHNNRGNTYQNLKEYKKAIADYTEAIRFNPQDANAYFNRAASYSNLKEYEKAIADCNEVILLNPNNANAYYGRGSSYEQLQDKDRAIEDFQQAANLHQQQGNYKWYKNALDRIKKLQ